jgi:hypothetical protein
LGRSSIHKTDELLDVELEEWKMMTIKELNELDNVNLMLSIDDETSIGKLACNFVHGWKSNYYIESNGFMAR